MKESIRDQPMQKCRSVWRTCLTSTCRRTLRVNTLVRRPCLQTQLRGVKHASKASAPTQKRPVKAFEDALPTLPVRSGGFPPPSPEQQVAINTLLATKNNIIIDAVAGSGKTTTILHLAQAAPDKRFLVLVYNRRLMDETQGRADAAGLTNMTVLNYHALGARYYTSECSTDQGLKRVVEEDMSVIPGKHLPDFSVLVLDEQQDLTPIMKRFVDKVIKDKGYADRKQGLLRQGSQLRMVVLGDRRQEIYYFNNADSRFLTMAKRKEVFGYVNDFDWIEADQTYSNRITQQNVDFINEQLLDLGRGMRAARTKRADGTYYPRPRYVIGDPVEASLKEINRLLDECKLKYEDILVLAPSTRGFSPAIGLANQLALSNIPVMRADSDMTEVPSDAASGRVLLCTYHQAKGIERPACVIICFDQSYHEIHDKKKDMPTVVSNAQYVAATRAKEHLILIHDKSRPPLPFVDLDTIDRTCEVIGPREGVPETGSVVDSKTTDPKPRVFSVTQLTRNLSETMITECLQHLRLELVVAKAKYVQPPPPTSVLDKHNLPEGISHITGNAVPAIFQWLKGRKLSILGDLRTLKADSTASGPKSWLRRLPAAYYDKLNRIKKKFESAPSDISVSDILFVAHVANSKISKDITKLLGIPLERYTWVSDKYSKHIVRKLGFLPNPAHIPHPSLYAVHFEKTTMRDFAKKPLKAIGGGPTQPLQAHGMSLVGTMDIVHYEEIQDTVWEIKHMDTLQPEHLLQVALYMVLSLKAESRGFLVSARTGQTVQVFPKDGHSLKSILRILVSAKSGGPQSRLLNSYTDEEFITEAGIDFQNIVGRCALPKWFSE